MSVDLRRVSERVWCRSIRLGGEAHVATYLVRGAGWAIVDTGVALPSNDPRALTRESFRSVPGFDDIDYVLLTHGHYDHAGGSARLERDFPSARVCLHERDVAMVETPSVQAEMMAAFAREWALPDEYAAVVVDRVAEHMQATTPDLLVGEGSRIDLGDEVVIEVCHLPGHTAGSVAYCLEDGEIAFVGDAVQGWGSRAGSWPLYSDPEAYVESLRKLRRRAPSSMGMAHGYQLGLPLSGLVVRGDDVPYALDHSATIAEQIGAAVRRSGSGPEPLRVAQGIVADLLGTIPARLDPGLLLPTHAAITLHAHGVGRDARP